MRLIATLLIIVMAGLPALFAGMPGLTPGWFDELAYGVPKAVLFMSALLAAFVILAALCSAAARSAAQTSEAKTVPAKGAE